LKTKKVQELWRGILEETTLKGPGNGTPKKEQGSPTEEPFSQRTGEKKKGPN